LATSSIFEEATFQAHLAIGEDLLTRFSEDDPTGDEQNPVIEAFHWSLKTDFDSGFKLTTGLSMEVLWKALRPIVVSKQQTMDTLAQMEQLAVRFDALRWNASISVSELGAIMNSLVNAYRLVLTSDVDGVSLVQTLDVEFEKLEASIGNEGDIKPFLAAQFEALRQYKTFRLEQEDIETIVLSSHSTASLMRLKSSPNHAARLFQTVDYLWGPGTGLQPIINTFSGSLLRKLNVIGEVDLKSLELLESELPILGEKLATSTRLLRNDQYLVLAFILFELMMCVISSSGRDSDEFSELGRSNLLEVGKNLGSRGISFANLDQHHILAGVQDVPVHVSSVIEKNFEAGLTAAWASIYNGEHRPQYAALAWVQFAVGAITLYVPDHAFDPDKRQRLERERHVKLRETLQNKLSALQKFEYLFTRQNSNLRCQVLEEEIAELGEPAEVLQKIYRPEISEMDQLQGEFKNLLKTVVQSNPYAKLIQYFSGGDQNGPQEIKLMQTNVDQIIRRLTERFRAYRDLTVPVVNILRCLQIGLSMAALAIITPSSNTETTLALCKMTPFLGGGPADADEALISSHPMEFLGLMVTTSATEGVSSFEPKLRQSLLKAFHGCYEQWSKRLETDRTEAESKSGLYRFRGSAEDEDEDDQEQFNELFPAYDDQSSNEANGASGSHTSRDTAVGLANIHSNIFLGGTAPSESMLSLVRQISKRLGALHDDEPHFDQHNLNKSILPGTLLILNDQIEELSSSATVPETYNFYTDANLPETRKLVILVHQIQARFRELQAVDEIGHMQPLEDVLVSCRELLQFRHTEPIAKIITKVENIHTYMHEWQFGGWASRANSALKLYDNITSTIVNWRRLELSTWAKLFDMETTKCDDDARSWWFIAYQVVIAAPLLNSDSVEQLRSYAQKLLKDLETYFSTAIVGQFVQRLQLLKQLHKHLEMLILEVPSMAIIRNALSNFIALYTRYEKPVEENLKKGRVSLEKAMRDVLLLASWKDTNIVALRDSAKRSHHKLFKVVRKFRSLLGQPMEFVLKQGLPDENITDTQDSIDRALVQFPTVDQLALTLCAALIPSWTEKSKRFINVSKTVGMMADASQFPESAVEGSTYLNSFLGNIITSTAQLQKATPSVLTDDNKDVVKHLKSRKRKLFADTLKELRQMGIKYNLGGNALSKQDSLSIVLASTEPLVMLKDFETQGIEYYFHKAIDLAPRARAAVHQHSEDLSSAEVARSTGFLEGLLQVVLIQRNALSVAVRSMTSLDQTIRVAKALWAPNAYDIRNANALSSHGKLVRRLPNILSVALELVKTHSKLGKIDNSVVQNFIIAWMDTFAAHSRDWNDLSRLPSRISSTERQTLEKLIEQSATRLVTEVRETSQDRPDLSFLLDQILQWIKIDSSEITENEHKLGTAIAELDQKLSTICNTVLAAIEKHKKSIKDLPSSTEDPGWLINNDMCLSNGIKSLHCDVITTQLEQAFVILRGLDLDDEKTSKSAGAEFAVALPILQQYFNILQQAVMRYAQLHRATCKTSYILAKTFTQIASQGFCTPSEKSDAQDGKTEKLEGGTGLGDGEGAEDISKDIQDDENLDELAQEPDTGNKEEIEDEKDAVDMADGDMEGEMGDAEEKGGDEEGSGDKESGDDMDEEAGDVDDLDPNAVDEKMWDGDGEQAEKDQEGDESKGKQSKDEQVAAQENNKEAAEGGDEGEENEDEEMGTEQGEEITQQDEAEKHDSHAQEGDLLDLPEDMELDGNEEEGSEASDDGIADLSDVEDIKEGEEIDNDGKQEPEGENIDPQEDQELGDDMDVIDLDDEKEDGGAETEEAGEKAESDFEEQQPEDQEGLVQDGNDEATADTENAVPSDVQGVGEDQDENAPDDKTETASKAQREDGGQGGDSSEQKESAAEDGEKGRQGNGDAPQDSKEETQDNTDTQPFKKLGDALESWHRQQTQIREAPESKEQGQDQNMDMNAETSEFQHLQDEDAEAHTQAMGTATEEQAHALDESMAVDPESNEMPEQFQPDEVEEDKMNHDDVMDLEDPSTPQEQNPSDAYEGRAGASINQAKEDRNEDLDDPRARGQEELEEDVEEVDRELESTHITNPEDLDLRSVSDARQQWTHYEAQTRDLSLSLTEQLRLILAPTLATKMRGDFRTGKRLNIKRIIPYIASQYKRDKIWMRRSVPSKRSYQIMLAVDDSKSMGESGSGSLAFETLVMVSKSLSMLEVGEICVVGFGQDVRVAHDFNTPFSSDAGPKVFQNFGFEQKRTDVTKLVRESIELFRAARAKASGSPSDLWQMELIISDGVCDSSEHEPIRRLLREALEERIMMVFVIVDDVKNKKKGESVMDLKEAKFVKDEMTGASNVKIERYLDTFPFQYYLIVSDVKELPGVLATLLRQWFAEVVDSSN
jgi:midasin